MRIPRIYHPDNIQLTETICLSKNASNHLLKVLRLKFQSKVRIFDGKGSEFLGTLVSINGGLASIKLEEKIEHAVESPMRLHLGQGISRGEKMDFVIQKAVELGVTKITPLFTQYCEVKLSQERCSKRVEHWRSVAIHACEQSGRNYLPHIDPPQHLSVWLNQRHEPLRIIFHPQASNSLKELQSNTNEAALLVGPEGGFSEEELRLASANQFQTLKLGPRILRTETAALAAVALLQFKWGDLS